MKKGFKKFLGAMAVLSIFGGSVGIGASAYKFNAVSVASVPGMTDEEVKRMNIAAEWALIVNEMQHTDESQWDKYLSRVQELSRIRETFKHGHLNWEDHFEKHESWKRATPAYVKVTYDIDDVSLYYKQVKLKRWFKNAGGAHSY